MPQIPYKTIEDWTNKGPELPERSETEISLEVQIPETQSAYVAELIVRK